MPEIDINVPAGQDTTTNTSTVGGKIMSPTSRQAIADEYAANKATAEAERAVGNATALQETVRADQQAHATDLLKQQAADQAAERQAFVDRQQAARDAATAAEDAFANHKFHDYWSDKGVGKRIAAGFALFAGGTGAGLVGGENPAQVALYRAMDKDFDKQKAQRESLKERSQMARQDVNDLYTQEGHENAAMAIKFAKANEATAAEMVQRLTEAGIPLEQAKSNKTVAGLLARAEEQRRSALQQYDQTYSRSVVTGHATGDPNKANENVVFDANGKPFQRAQSPQAAKEFRDSQGAVTALGQAIGELKENYKKGTVLPGGLTQAGRERAAIMSRITLAAKTLGELGALSGPDMGLVNDIAGGKLGTIMANPQGITNLERLHDNALNTMISKVGAQPSPEARSRFRAAPGDTDQPAGEQAPMDVPTARKTMSNPQASFDDRKKAARVYEGEAKAKRGGGKAAPAQQYPIGTRATSGGKPIVMTADGWQLAQ